VALSEDPYYRRGLALVHHRGFGFHVRACAPGIVALLEPVRSREGIILELGCGSGLLTRELTAAGHRVIATDASPAILDRARSYAPAAEDIRTLVLPGDPLPPADAVVSAGHVLSYLPDETAIDQALTAIARALRPGGLFAIGICDLAYGQARRDAPSTGLAGGDWAIIARVLAARTPPVRAPDHHLSAQRRRLLAPRRRALPRRADRRRPRAHAARGRRHRRPGGFRVRNRAVAYRAERADRTARRLTNQHAGHGTHLLPELTPSRQIWTFVLITIRERPGLCRERVRR